MDETIKCSCGGDPILYSSRTTNCTTGEYADSFYIFCKRCQKITDNYPTKALARAAWYAMQRK